jgi:hypothetical protein
MLVGKQADGEGMASYLRLRDVSFSYLKEKKGLTRGTHIEAVSFNPDHSFMLPKEIILHRKNRAPEVKRITYDLMGLGKKPRSDY